MVFQWSTEETKNRMKAYAGILISILLLVLLQRVAFAEPGTVVTDDGKLAMRLSPDVGAAILTKLRNGSQVEVLETVDENWYRISYNGIEGYVKSQSIKLLSSAVETTNSPQEMMLEGIEEEYSIAATENGDTTQLENTDTGSAFTIHNGTKFGMTETEVISLEKKSGFTAQRNSDGTLYFEGKIAGYKDSFVYYGFNTEGKLVSVSYSIGEDSNTSRYVSIRDALISKYGNVWNDFVVFKDVGALNHALYDYNLLSSILSVKLTNADQWLVPVENGYVSITAIGYYVTAASNQSEVGISYEFVSEANYNSTMQERAKEQQQVNDDL